MTLHRFAILIPWLLASGYLQALPVLDFATTADGFSDTGSAGGSLTRATDTGGGSLRMTNPAAWTWRGKADFLQAGSGKSLEMTQALRATGQSGGFLHFDLILRPGSSASGTTGGFWGVQYLVALHQQVPEGGSGWFQTMAHYRNASGYPVATETVIPVTVPLGAWASSGSDLRINPDSPYYQIQLGSNSGGVTQVEWHVDNMRVESLPATPGAIQLEAENATLTGVTAATTASGFNGTGYVTGFDQAGDRVSWSFNAAGGVHRMLIRYRTALGTKGFSGTLNGGGVSGYFPANNGFAVFDAGLVDLIAGSNTLSIGGGWNYYEIDSVTLAPEQPPAPPSPGPAIPMDPNATPATKALLAAIAANYGTKAYSGQHEADDLAVIQTGSGKLPAIFSGDLINYSPTRTEHGGVPAGYTESLIGKAGEGYILSTMWHWNAPANLLNTSEQPWWRGFYTEATTFDVAAALANPAGPEHALMLRDIDAIAVQLKKIQQAGVPVLWRPLHEAEGGWFWWGAKGPEAYKQLWRLLFTRLTQHHGLHNLIWVLTVEDPAWYPGNDVVDVVGVDAYPDDRTDALLPRWQPLRERFDGVKPIALTEFGGVPDIEKMQHLGVWWAWFCSWQGVDNGPQSAPAAMLQRIYQSAGVITRDELPAPDPAHLDSNNDGVTDAEAMAMGFTVTQGLGPAILFFRENAARFSLGAGAVELAAARENGRSDILTNPNAHGLYTDSQLHALATGHPFLTRDPGTGNFTLKLKLSHSVDLTHWSGIGPDGVGLEADGSITVELPAMGNAAFYRLQGEEP